MDKRFKILVVDDERINIQVMTSALKNEYEIIAAQNGFDAIDLIKENKPDLILLDVMMPDLDGYAVCRTIKADASFADIPVIFLTALDTHDEELRGLRLGGIDYLTKPVNFDLLKLRLRNHLELKERNDLVREQRDELALQKEELARMLAELERQYERQRETEREKLALERQLHQAQKLESLGVLAGGIAHDFNNILAIIIGHCYMVKMDTTTAADYIPTIEKAADRAAELCRQMLAYAGKAKRTQSQVNLKALVGEMVSLLKSTVKQNIKITSHLSANIPIIRGDSGQIKQIAMNLIVNAAEAIGEATGEIEVRLARTVIRAGQSDRDHLGKVITSGWYVCLEVTDTGCGMDDEIKQRIFDPFYSSKFIGRGLGMSAVLGIITEHGGALQLSSQPGQGTTVKAYLPVQNSDSAGDESPQQPFSDSRQVDGANLPAEDDDHL
jgi:signal transduction histidine kinase